MRQMTTLNHRLFFTTVEMDGFQALVRWFKKPSKSSNKKAKSSMKFSILYPGRIEPPQQNSPPTKACLCRASMTLPPTPHELSQDGVLGAGRLVWGRSCIDSPPHVYEEIPPTLTPGPCTHYCDVTTCPQSGCDVIRRAQLGQKAQLMSMSHHGRSVSDPDEYLAPTSNSVLLGKNTDKIIQFPDGTLCKYDKISPLSALGLTLTNLKKCQRCQRPHGVYNGTVYRHGSNSSPDLVNMEWHCFRPTNRIPHSVKAPPTASQQAPPPGETSHQATPLSPSARLEGRGHYHSIGDLRSAGQCTSGGREKSGDGARKGSLHSAFTAFQVLKPDEHQRLADLTSREVHAADVITNSGEYAYYLSKVKQNFRLGQQVQNKSKTRPDKVRGERRGGKIPQSHNPPPSIPQLPPSGKRTKLGSKSMTNLHSVAKSDLDYKFDVAKDRDSHLRFNTLQHGRTERKYGAGVQGESSLSDAAMERLSCRVTNFKLTPRATAHHGDRRSSYSEVRHGGSRGLTHHNPLLSDIMRRNHDRLNLVV